MALSGWCLKNTLSATNATNISELTTSGFIVKSDSGSVGDYYTAWLALGVQAQWGTCVSSGSISTTKFPIPFTKNVFYVGCIPWKTLGSGYCPVASTVTLSDFQHYYYQASSLVNNCYLAIGD